MDKLLEEKKKRIEKIEKQAVFFQILSYEVISIELFIKRPKINEYGFDIFILSFQPKLMRRYIDHSIFN